MSNQEGDILEQVSSLFVNWGADRGQAEVMARQLLKRATQIASERKISEVDALETLLKQVLEARQGS